MHIGIIGCGHMGSAVAKAFLAKKNWVIWVGNPYRPRIKLTSRERKLFKWTVDNITVVKEADIIVIAVKPDIVQIVLTEIQHVLRPSQLLISIAAGISLKNLFRFSKGHRKIARVMPNLPAQVFDAISVWKPLAGLSAPEKKRIRSLLNSFGKSIEVKDEKLIDMATAISGSGPAYVAAFLESMEAQACKIGFSKKEARLLALETVNGTLDYIKKTGVEFAQLKNAVQTKGGTTEAAFKILKKEKWQKVLKQAIFAAYCRARSLSHS